MNILDCTLRDGGYYTDWHFDLNLARRYLRRSQAPDVVEIGFRSPPGNSGPFRYCTEAFLYSLGIPDDVTIAVMVNLNEWDRRLFTGTSRVNMVRVAAHLEDLPRARAVLCYLKDAGYTTALNIMQAHRATDGLLMFVGLISDELDVLYFADSFGGMDGKDIDRVCNLLRRWWQGDLGFHAHDNKGRAFENSRAAGRCGVSWLDGTVLGMGRGAGNTDLKYLLSSYGRSYCNLPEFEELKRIHGWGPNWLYSMAATFNIHPTKVQNLLCR